MREIINLQEWLENNKKKNDKNYDSLSDHDVRFLLVELIEQNTVNVRLIGNQNKLIEEAFETIKILMENQGLIIEKIKQLNASL